MPAAEVLNEAKKRGATPYDVKDVELGHHGAECSFEAFVHKYDLAKDPAMADLAEAILDGLGHVHYLVDQKQREASRPVMDALYAYCKEKMATKTA